jgi:hypothetical protein
VKRKEIKQKRNNNNTQADAFAFIMRAAWLSSDTFILTCQLNDVGAQGSVSFVK